MKFSITLQFNAVPEWREHYIDYDQLKRLIFRLERRNVPAYEDENLAGEDAVKVFSQALDKEVERIDEFYKVAERDILTDARDLVEKLNTYFASVEAYPDANRRPATVQSHPISSESVHPEAAQEPYVDDPAAGSESSDEDNPPPILRRKSTIHDELVRHKSIPFENVSLRRSVTRFYVLLNELLSFSDLNREGFRKALKKFDKVLGTSLLRPYMSTLGSHAAFSDESNHKIGQLIDKLVIGFAKLANEPESVAAEKLSGMLREHVVYERNTVWRELIGLERSADRAGQDSQPTVAEKQKKYVFVMFGIGVPAHALYLLAISIAFLVSLGIPMLAVPVQSRCLSIVLLASLLWATESLPLFVTALLVPLLVVVLRIPLDADGEPMPAKQASAFVFSRMWSPVIVVLLGGFTLAAALSKYNLAKALAQMILARVGNESPRAIMLALMFVGAFLCMWISNVAAPVLCFSVAQPLIRVMPRGDSFPKALILGIALASNIGGTASPIASPQNILALQNMDPVASWFQWFAIALPVATVCILIVWAFLCLTFPISLAAKEALQQIPSHSSGTSISFGRKHIYVLCVTVFTILLWCFSHQLESVFGDMGVLALVPIVLLFGTGVLNAADFNNFLWTIVALAMGGIVLGQAVESCGLLATVASGVQSRVAHLPLFGTAAVLCFAILILASFISHTVAALIVLPLVKTIGEQLGDPHPRLLVMLSALVCSCAMALPTSGFPNVTAVCMMDEVGKPYLTAIDFISRGLPASIIAYFVIITVGYAVARLIGF